MSRCNDCAFTPGTEANGFEWTRIKAQLCAMTGDRFDCHVNPGQCQGWLEAKQSDAVESWKADALRGLLEGMHDVEHADRINAARKREGIPLPPIDAGALVMERFLMALDEFTRRNT